MFAHEFYHGEPARPLVAVHPGSGGESKVWSMTNWAALCRWLIEEKKAHILLIGGEADQANVAELRMLIEPLHVALPFGGYNGGTIVTPDFSVVEQKLVPPEAARTAVEMFRAYAMGMNG